MFQKTPNQAPPDELEVLQTRTLQRQREASESLRRSGKHVAFGYQTPKERILTTFLASRQAMKGNVGVVAS
jgi:hypothetical protein